jgi:hypothetical protein
MSKNAIDKAIYYHPDTGQLLYTRYMKPEDDGYKKGMKGAFDSVNDKLICRHYDNLSPGIEKRGFVYVIHENYVNNKNEQIKSNVAEINRLRRELKLSMIVEHKEMPKLSYHDFTEEDKKKKELSDNVLTQFVSVVSSKSKTKTRDFMKYTNKVEKVYLSKILLI